MPKKSIVCDIGRISVNDELVMAPDSPYGNGKKVLTVKIVYIKGEPDWLIGVMSSAPMAGWHDLDGRVSDSRGYWVGLKEIAKYFKPKKSMLNKRMEVKGFKFRQKDMTGTKCKILAGLPDGKSSFVECDDYVGGCGSDGLGKAGHCIVVPNENLVEEEKSKNTDKKPESTYS